MQDHILVSVSPFYNGHGWTDHGTGIDFKPVNGLRAFRIDLKDNQDLRGIRNSIRLNHLLLLEGELPEMGEPRPEDANPAELTHEEYTTLLEGLRSAGDNSELESQLQNTKDELVNANGRITQLNSELQTAKTELQTTKGDLATANNQITQINSELQSTKTELADANGEVSRLESDLDDTKTELQNTETELTTANGEITRLESELDDTKTELDSTKTQLDSANSQVTQLNSKLQTAEDDLADKDGQITQLQATIDALEAQLADLQAGSGGDVEPQSLGYTKEELESKTAAELQQLAEDENIELTTTLKADIIQEILDAQ